MSAFSVKTHNVINVANVIPTHNVIRNRCEKQYLRIKKIVAKCNTCTKRNKKSLRNVIPTHNVIRNFHEM